MKDHGFTLLELLIVLCVLMITLAIGIPRTAIALFVATMLAWLVCRTNIAGRRWIVAGKHGRAHTQFV